MTAGDLLQRIDVCSDELLALHDSVKIVGVEAEFPYPHHWNADQVGDLLAEAHRAAAEAARLVAKIVSTGS